MALRVSDVDLDTCGTSRFFTRGGKSDQFGFGMIFFESRWSTNHIRD